MQRVARAHRSWPAKLVYARGAEAALRAEPAGNKQPHHHARGVPAARDEAAERTVLGRRRVDVKRLRVVLTGEFYDLRPANGKSAALPGEPGHVVLKVERLWGSLISHGG